MEYSSVFRKEIWDEYTKLEYKLTDLKALVQNPMPIRSEDLVNQVNIGRELTNELIDIQVKLEKEFKKIK